MLWLNMRCPRLMGQSRPLVGIVYVGCAAPEPETCATRQVCVERNLDGGQRVKEAIM